VNVKEYKNKNTRATSLHITVLMLHVSVNSHFVVKSLSNNTACEE